MNAIERQKKRLTKGGAKTRLEISAGGIVFKRTPQGVRVAFILDPFGKWAFAKGHVEKGETIEDAAYRETREEMGLGRLRMVAKLGKIDFWFHDRYRSETRGVLIHKHVHFFLFEAPPEAKGRPQKKEKIRRLIWVPLRNISSVSGYKDVRPIINKAKEYFSGSGRGAGGQGNKVNPDTSHLRTSASQHLR